MGEPARKLYDLTPYHWQKGQSGNPSGARAYPKDVAALLLTKRRDWTPELLEGLHGIAISGENDRDRIKASELLLSYLIGKPREMPPEDAPQPDLPVEVRLAAARARTAELEAEMKGKNGGG